ncbi:MAG TPA: lipopolysaccharide heptosyltransferase II [Albitalea sp.]|uniref:lipopolysaccharide heptosyltransferase II n=1 Tax=Piscinibacter sp. TaxID=1903157 RepID=UPI002ED131D3
MTRAVVVAPQWIGDAVMSEPLLARLAARGEAISVAALPWVAPVYRAMPQVAEVIELPFAHGRLDWAGRRRVAAEWRGRFDVAYVLPNSLKSALIPFLARIARRVGYRGEGRIGLLNERLPNPPGRPPMVAFYSALAGPAPTGERPRLSFDEATLAGATSSAGVERGRYFVFAPGAEYGPSKRWPATHYAELARSLQARHGLPVLLLGSRKEAALCEEIAAIAPCRVVAGSSLEEAMALIAASRGMVSNDSGLMHVAAAFEVPQVAVFGSTSPEHTPPLNPKARVLWLKDELGLDCMPCFERTCRYGHYRCLVDVAPARVESALEDSLR